jgi:phosphocarrier protein
MPERQVSVGSRIGLHARPAATVAEAAGRQSVPVLIGRPGAKPVNAASVLALMSLGAKSGELVVISVNGADDATAEEAVAEIAALVERDLDAEPAGDG